jgi:hypothetical protein
VYIVGVGAGRRRWGCQAPDLRICEENQNWKKKEIYYIRTLK